MATKRVPMRKIREILRLKWQLGKSNRETARSLGLSPSTVSATVQRAGYAKLDWSQVQTLADDELERLLYGAHRPSGRERPMPDFARLAIELRRPGVTRELLHWEYLQEHPDGYGYSRFCELYKQWKSKSEPTMRQVHKGGEKLFVDYSGKKPAIIDRTTGELRPVELFVAVLGASNYSHAEATLTQRSQDFIASHIRAFEHLGGVPAAVVPDQLKSAVTKACSYEPTIQRTYEEMARHYDTAIIPARPRKPRDKAKVEAGVQAVQNFILGRLRDEQFFSLQALNERIAEMMDEFNERPMQGYGGASRRQLFHELDRPELRPLPAQRFIHAEWKQARVNIDYHIDLDRHYYSVPYQLVQEAVEVRYTATTVEIFYKGKRTASHVRSYDKGRHTTKEEHMPASHRAHRSWSPSRLIHWADSVGPHVKVLVEAILGSRRHPEHGYRSCLGILRLQKHYGSDRLDAACRRAHRFGGRSYKSVKSILRNGLDRQPLPDDLPDERQATTHENIRGPSYYDPTETPNAH
jgi:transposase